jgi:hypothetical protein
MHNNWHDFNLNLMWNYDTCYCAQHCFLAQEMEPYPNKNRHRCTFNRLNPHLPGENRNNIGSKLSASIGHLQRWSKNCMQYYLDPIEPRHLIGYRPIPVAKMTRNEAHLSQNSMLNCGVLKRIKQALADHVQVRQNLTDRCFQHAIHLFTWIYLPISENKLQKIQGY